MSHGHARYFELAFATGLQAEICVVMPLGSGPWRIEGVT